MEDKILDRFKDVSLTEEFIRKIPKLDLHVHLPGTISPQTAWKLGVRNKFITIQDDKVINGPNSLAFEDPHEHYTEVFNNPSAIILQNGEPINLSYNTGYRTFKNFYMVMATVQGHRHPPGGIQNEEDLHLVLHEYLKECIEQNIFYTELQQNIRIAYSIYPGLHHEEARIKFYQFLAKVVKEYEANGVFLRFLHCFNKTKAAGLGVSAKERALEAAQWLEESKNYAQGVFVGIESAGHEKDESGWPIHLLDGYKKAHELGFGCEAHGGEGIGVDHMLDVARTLPITRIAHGFQIVESKKAIEEFKEKNIVLLTSPYLNLVLGATIHTNKDDLALNISKSEYGRIFIDRIADHPFFPMLREYGLKISICSDNPRIGGATITDLILMLAGIKNHDNYLPDEAFDFGDHKPLDARELITTLLVGIECAFCDDKIKEEYKNKLDKFLLAV